MTVKALFLDRDWVVNIDHGYVSDRRNFEFVDGIFNLLTYTADLDYIIITSQAGIGRGYYTELQFNNLIDWMVEKFLEAGVAISDVYFSPYHPIAGVGLYLKDHFSRKTRPGMILQAERDFAFDLKDSLLIGDKASDIQAGVTTGVGTNLLFAAEHPNELSGLNNDLIATLHEAIPYLQRGV